MATLPDLDKENVSFVAYWNALNHGADTIDPTDATSASPVLSTTYYDNGVVMEMEYEYTHNTTTTIPDDRTITVRVKGDGWVVAYIDRTEELATDATSWLAGPWDICDTMFGETYGNSAQSFQENLLAKSIKTVVDNLGNSGNITFNWTDVSLYNYEYGAASVFTAFGRSSDNSMTDRFSYTSGTSIEKGYATAGATGTDFVGDSIINMTPNNDYAAIDITNDIPNSGTSYGHDASGGAYVWALIGWS